MTLLPGSFKNRLILLFAGLSLLVALPLYFYIEQVYARQMLTDRGEALQGLATAVSTALAENLHERQREIELLATTPIYQIDALNLDNQKLAGMLNRLKDSYQHYSWIGFADTQGKVQASSGDLLLGQDVSQRPWFTQGLNGSYVGDLHEALLLSKLLPPTKGEGPVRFIDFAAPVLGADAQPIGVVAAHAHWAWADAVIKALEPVRENHRAVDIFILNGKQQIIYPDLIEAQPDERFLQQVVKSGWGTERSDGVEYLAAISAVPEIVKAQPLGWSVLIRQPMTIARYVVDQLQNILLVFGSSATLVFLLLAWWSAGRISRPLEQLAHVAERIEQGDESAAVPMKATTTEVRALSQAISSMANSLIARRLKLLQANEQLEEKVVLRTRELQEANIKLEHLARTDPLTGMLNRLAANERLEEEFARLQRTHSAYALLLLDIDHFKRINDSYGHPVGDQALQFVARLVRETIRNSDLLYRVGGEEFLVLLPATHGSAAMAVAEKVRACVAESPEPTVGQITLSIGIAQAQVDDASSDDAILRADHGLYAAKAAGRNCIRLS